MNIQHSSVMSTWMTPPNIIDMVRDVMGNIDLDPCTNINNNCGANKFYTKADDGLSKEWLGSVYINPPGGKTRNKSNTILFWEKLMNSNVDQAIFMAFSIEALQTSQDKGFKSLGEFPLCIPNKRIRFVDPNGNRNSPSHSNCIVYIPGAINNTDKFVSVFSNLGIVLNK